MLRAEGFLFVSPEKGKISWGPLLLFTNWDSCSFFGGVYPPIGYPLKGRPRSGYRVPRMLQ